MSTVSWLNQEVRQLQAPHQLCSAPSAHPRAISAGGLSAVETQTRSTGSSGCRGLGTCFTAAAVCTPSPCPVPLAVSPAPRNAALVPAGGRLPPPLKPRLMGLQQTQCCLDFMCHKGLQMLQLVFTGPGEDRPRLSDVQTDPQRCYEPLSPRETLQRGNAGGNMAGRLCPKTWDVSSLCNRPPTP